MLFYISGEVLVCLEYSSKNGMLHQGLDYIVYLWYCIDFDCITVVLKVSEYFLFVSLDVADVLTKNKTKQNIKH